MKAAIKIGLIAIPLMLAGSAHAVIVDFEDLAINNAVLNTLPTDYVSQGFEFSSGSNLQEWGTQSAFYPGSNAIFAGGNEVTFLNRVDHGVFTLNSMDLCSVFLHDSDVQDITFTGKHADLTTVQETIHMGAPGSMHTFTFSSMTNVVQVIWGQVAPYHQFDNVNANAVPEPVSLTALALGIGTIIRRRRTH